MGQKKNIKLLKKILHNPNKRNMYSHGELLYMEKHLELMLLQKARKKMNKNGFAN